jgi:hypothetical protein
MCVARFRFDLNGASMLLHNSLHRVESEASSFSDSLGGEKWFEDMRLNLG